MARKTVAVPSFAWLVILVLFLGSVINYIDRAVLGVVMPQIRRDLTLSNADYGLAVNAFLALYTVFYILGGRLADWLGCRRTFSLSVIFWSVAAMLHALAKGLGSLSFYRALLGMGQGGYYPTAMRGAAEWFPPADRAKAVGLLLCGISVGTLVTPPIVAWTTAHYGWRHAFLITGALGALLLAPWLILHRRIARAYGTHDPAPALRQEPHAGTTADVPLLQALRRRQYWFLLAARALGDAAWYYYLFWMPGYFQEARGFDLKMVGGLLWIPYFASDIGALGGAWASSALIRHGWSLDRGRKTLLVPSAALCMCGAFTGVVPGAYAALLLVSVALLGHQSWSSNIHTAITETTPPRHVAVLYGMTGAAGTLAGALSQPAIGKLIDAAGYAPAFACAGSVYVASVALLLTAGRIESG